MRIILLELGAIDWNKTIFHFSNEGKIFEGDVFGGMSGMRIAPCASVLREAILGRSDF